MGASKVNVELTVTADAVPPATGQQTLVSLQLDEVSPETARKVLLLLLDADLAPPTPQEGQR